MELVIRRARPGDKRAVREVVRTIWGGQDRVPGLFDRWVTQRTGPFFVAEVGRRVVGMGKLTVISRAEAWLEGGRVAPRYRRRGIATALIAHRIAYARRRGFRVLRFSTAEDNTPIHRAARRFRFRRARAFRRYTAAANSAVAPPRRAAAADTRALQRILGPYLQVAPGWEWRTLGPHDVELAIAGGRAFVAGRAGVSAGALVGRSSGAGELPIVAVGGRGRALRELLSAMRGEAARRHRSEVDVYLARPVDMAAAEAAGYARPWRLAALLYELTLPRRHGDGGAGE